MTDKTWFGGSGSFSDPSDWSPSGVPQAGDTATINSGTCHITDLDLRPISLVVGGYDGAVLALDEATLGSVTLIPSPVTGDAFGTNTIDVSGRTTLAGNITSGAEGTFLTFVLAPHAILVNDGMIQDGQAQPSSVSFAGGNAQLVNNGSIIAAGDSRIAAAVLGTGTIQLNGVASPNLHIATEFVGSVDARQTFAFSDPDPPTAPSSDQAWLEIDDPHGFQATIAGFGIDDHIRLTGITATSGKFSGGVLTLLDNSTVVDRLHFAGSYSSADFVVTHRDDTTFVAFK